jgi:hypothetical protein
MEVQATNYRREFLASPQHAALGLFTLGVGFLSANPLALIVGGTLYALGWIYLPDLPFFRNWVDRREAEVRRVVERQRVAEFVARRDQLLNSLSVSRGARYQGLAAVCHDIEVSSVDSALATADAGADPRLRKLDELMWTYLRLLGIEESLALFLEAERQEDLPRVLQEADREARRLTGELEALKSKDDKPAVETKHRYLGSRLERLEVLRKRQQRLDQAQENLALVVSEQERLDQQIKLIRADAIATKNAEALTARIDATVEHLDQTNKWLSELDQFKDLVADLPATEMRVGYAAETLPTRAAAARGARPAIKVPS